MEHETGCIQKSIHVRLQSTVSAKVEKIAVGRFFANAGVPLRSIPGTSALECA